MYILPRPQEFSYLKDVFYLNYDSQIFISREWDKIIYHYAEMLRETIEEETGLRLNINCGKSWGNAITIIKCEELEIQEYRLMVEEHRVCLYASNRIGVLYGIQTLKQIFQQCGAVIPGLYIKDFPSFPVRGLYYDVTRCRIPTVEYLKKLIDKLAFYKINQFQLYIEHTYMFRKLSEMWRDDTPLTSDEILELDEYCADRNIELVPSIATFGHLYKLLRTKTYRELCEQEELCDDPFGFVDRMEHHTIDITNEKSFCLITSLIDEYSSLFRSDKFNICGDETMDLGKGKGKKYAETVGISNMYIQYVNRLCEYLIDRGKTPMFWGDIIGRYPEKIKALPKKTIFLNWEYEMDVNEQNTKSFSDAGVLFYNCPGVSGWDQLINRYEVAYNNIKKMCEFGKKYHAIGILNTDWGDCGHVNHPDMSVIGIIYGACFSWNDIIPEHQEIDKQISLIEYRNKDGKFVSILWDVYKLWVFKWRTLVNIKEGRESYPDATMIPDFKNAICDLDNRKKILLLYISKLDSKTRTKVRPYIIGIDGMILLQKVGIVLSSREKAQEMGLDVYSVAEEIENWFYHYKEEWCKVSKEGELYRVAEVIYWVADTIRNCKGED